MNPPNRPNECRHFLSTCGFICPLVDSVDQCGPYTDTCICKRDLLSKAETGEAAASLEPLGIGSKLSPARVRSSAMRIHSPSFESGRKAGVEIMSQQVVIRCRRCRRITSVVDVPPDTVDLEEFRLTLNGELCSRCKPAQKPPEARQPMSDP